LTDIAKNMKKTSQQFDTVIKKARDIFVKKMKDYGSAWRVLRMPSFTNQMYIKASRIRQLQEASEQKVDESEVPEFLGLINYAAMALIQLDKGVADQPDMNLEEAIKLYDQKIAEAKNLMLAKNHDYGEAWRDMRVSSITDLIIQKLYRVKQIEENKGKTRISEGIDANYLDIINYAVFALILMMEQGDSLE
jgi:hypothetical protein